MYTHALDAHRDGWLWIVKKGGLGFGFGGGRGWMGVETVWGAEQREVNTLDINEAMAAMDGWLYLEPYPDTASL